MVSTRLPPGKTFALAVSLAGISPKNLLLSIGAGAALAQTGVSTSDAIAALIVHVLVASVTIAGPVIYYFVGGAKARAALDSVKGWLAVHNAAVMMVLFLILGATLIADGLPVLGG